MKAAAYVQGRARLGKLETLGGMRIERTELEAMGTLNDSRRPTVAYLTRSKSYRDWFPSLHLNYEVRPKLMARASFSTGFARPGLNSLYPVTTVVYNQWPDQYNGTDSSRVTFSNVYGTQINFDVNGRF